MITNYCISYKKDEIILTINLDFNYEFADFNIKNFTKNLKDEIYILAHKVNANKIKILINGALITTLLLPTTSLNENYNNTISFITSTTIKESLNKNYDEKVYNTVEDIKQENNNTTIVNKKEEKPVISTQVNTNTKDIQKIEANIKEISNKTNSSISNNNINLETYVTIHRSNGSILELELEEYLIGVVGSEMPASFNIEALKAQAIVARTYALKCISENKILTDNTNTQVFKDNNQLREIWKDDFDKYYYKIKNAVLSTKGIVLTYNNKYIDAVYHSTSNGYTEDSIYVWGYNIPYLKQVESKYDTYASSFKRERKFSLEEISKLLNTSVNIDTIFILERNNSNRVINVKVNDIEINGTTFRNLLGLRSTDFSIDIIDESVIITTYGYGHGVGMSQYGANGMADNGYNYKDILLHYYKDVKIEKE